ncbi:MULTISPECIES: hypothetical protein [unclassified Nocardiopsis]|uniref:hypothetical protein n=1 Tax=unclassified Nocardiopsis TaxID=2649073 RepID=UPI0013587DEB|nr:MULTISPECIES: hypothetical protein [unclassified Nocardiopsis]
MDTLRCGADLDRIPVLVREDLTDADRLRAIWAQHRQSQPRQARGAARRELTRRRVQELGGGPALEELVVSTSVDGTSGQPVTAEFVAELAERTRALPPGCSSRAPGRPLDPEQALRVARAASVPAHPVVRAAHTYAECAAVLGDLGSEGEPHRWALPWLLASLVLRRADFPPLLPDPASPPPRTGPDPDQRLAGLVRHFARLVTGALLDELSWTPEPVPEPRSPVSPLAAVTRRRVLDYVRSRRESIALILRALDPRARTSVFSGGSDDAEPGTAAATVAGTLLTPGAAHWWTALELVVGEASLCLFVVVQEVGSPRTGVLAVTADARMTTPEGVRDALRLSGADSVTVMPTDCVDDRWPQIRDLVDEAVSRAMNELTRV